MDLRRLSTLAILAGAVGASLLSVERAAAQSGSRILQTQPAQRSQPRLSPEEFQKAFWEYLSDEERGYLTWTSWPGRNGLYEGQSPHGAWLKMYANRQAAFSPERVPQGAIVVKENYGEDKKTLMAITAMYRTPGYNPQAGDWYWIKYNPDGTVDRTPEEMGAMPIAGKFQMCIDCHAGAAGDDWLFANDK